MVNNAGQWGGYISQATLSEYNDIMETNAKRTFFLTRLVAKYMIDEWVKGNILYFFCFIFAPSFIRISYVKMGNSRINYVFGQLPCSTWNRC